MRLSASHASGTSRERRGWLEIAEVFTRAPPSLRSDGGTGRNQGRARAKNESAEETCGAKVPGSRGARHAILKLIFN
jgi:hypothetical protein